LPLFCLLVLSVLLLSCAGARRDESGRVVTPGELNTVDLRIGDCFQNWTEVAAGGTTRLSSLEVVPCDEPHDNEVFHIDAYGTSTSLEWPGEDRATSYASAVCLGAFESYVGSAHASSRLDYGYIRPTLESWEQHDDRRVACFLFSSTGEPLTGSMHGWAE
jgi:hypothetical protein